MKVLAITLLLLSSYRLALPGYEFEFPRDHGNHQEFKLEWWYFTGHLDTAEGRHFGYELTFFRTGIQRETSNPSVWTVTDLYPAHFALSDLDREKFYYFEKVNRGGPGIAGAKTGHLEVWNENWRAVWDEGIIRLRAAAEGMEIELELEPAKPPVIHGRQGVSQKGAGEGRASHYYSFTRLASRGRLIYQDEQLQVTGESWMDHEFGTNQLSPEQVGWDWFSLQFEEPAEELMIFQLRRSDGSPDAYSAGTAVSPDGSGEEITSGEFSLKPLDFWQSPDTEASYPIRWQIEIPALDSSLRVVAMLPNQELVTTRSTGIAYWEGAVEVTGTWKGQPVKGRGYLEMTGYQERFRPNI